MQNNKLNGIPRPDMGAANIPPTQQIDPKDLTEVKCKECGGEFFKQSFMIKKISMIQSQDGKEKITAMQVMLCERCNTPMIP